MFQVWSGLLLIAAIKCKEWRPYYFSFNVGISNEVDLKILVPVCNDQIERIYSIVAVKDPDDGAVSSNVFI